MTYFCFIDTSDSQVPHMEAAPADDLAGARSWALKCLKDQRRPVAARIFADDVLVETVVWRDAPAGRRREAGEA